MNSGDNAGTLNRLFENKVGLQEVSLKAEAVLPRLVPAAATGLVATTLTLLGVWDYIPHETRPYVLGLAALAATAPAAFIKAKNPLSVTRRDALERISRNHGDLSMPALMLDEKLEDNASPITKIFWEDHLKKTRQKIKDLKVSWPQHKLSPNTQLAGMILATALGASFIAAGDNTPERLKEPFRFTAPIIPEPPAQVMAWITPPKNIQSARGQTLPEGAIQLSPLQDNNEDTTLIDSIPATPLNITNVHQQSILHISVVGGTAAITINGQPLTPEEEILGEDLKITSIYSTPLNDANTIVSFTNGPVWNIAVTQDYAPELTITGMTQNADGSLQMRCIAHDDFGIKQSDLIFAIPGAHPDAAPPPQAQIEGVPLNTSTLCNNEAPQP